MHYNNKAVLIIINWNEVVKRKCNAVSICTFKSLRPNGSFQILLILIDFIREKVKYKLYIIAERKTRIEEEKKKGTKITLYLYCQSVLHESIKRTKEKKRG